VALPAANATVGLTNAQLRRALIATGELVELRDLSDYPARAVELLQSLIPCDITSYNAVDPSGGDAAVLADPAETLFAGGDELFASLAHENPLVSHYARTGDGSALRISDFMTRGQLHGTDLYDQVYHRIEVEYQLAITLPSPRRALGRPGEIVGLTLSRGRRDFSDAERALLGFVRPHFAATLERLHELALSRATGEGGAGQHWLLLTDRDGGVAWANAPAIEGLEVAVGGPPPAAIAHWVAEERARTPGVSLGPRTLRLGGVRVRASFAPEAYPGLDAVSLRPIATAPGPADLTRLDLTPRQAEVMALVLEGLTSAQVAQALVLSPRTVEKHLEAIYARLGVENRAQAVASVLRSV
jgi:DNA-binding CsgD family transcriptional regulator